MQTYYNIFYFLPMHMSRECLFSSLTKSQLAFEAQIKHYSSYEAFPHRTKLTVPIKYLSGPLHKIFYSKAYIVL